MRRVACLIALCVFALACNGERRRLEERLAALERQRADLEELLTGRQSAMRESQQQLDTLNAGLAAYNTEIHQFIENHRIAADCIRTSRSAWGEGSAASGDSSGLTKVGAALCAVGLLSADFSHEVARVSDKLREADAHVRDLRGQITAAQRALDAKRSEVEGNEGAIDRIDVEIADVRGNWSGSQRLPSRQSCSRRVFCCVARLLALALLLASSAAVSAAPGLDLAVLIDCSGSMARYRGNEVLLLRMTADLLVRNAEANRVEHRLAVIRFGSSASVDVPFTSARHIRPRLNAMQYEDRGETNVLAAFVEAEKLFRSLPASPERRKAIVLLTDGVPYVRGGDMPAYRANLRQFAAAHFVAAGVTIDVLLIDSRYDAMWRHLARVEPVGGTSDRLLASAHGVIARLAGTQTAESARAKSNPAIDTLIVPPYLDVIVFDILRLSAGVTVEIFPPGSAAPIRPGAGGIESVRLGDVLTTLVVPRPEPGEWVIRKSRDDARVRILSQQFFPRGLLLRPAPTEMLRQCDRVPLAYRVLDGRGRPFEELPDYALALDLTVALPSGTSATMAMERDSSLGVCAFRSAQDMKCDLPGRYWTDVRITTVAADGHRLDVFRDRWSGFSVVTVPGKNCTGRVIESRMVADAPMVSKILVVALLTAVAVIAAWMRFRKTKS